MDVNTLMKLMLSSNSTNALSKKAGASTDQVTSILNNVLPMLLNGASAQATNQATAAGFASALDAHGAKDTSDLGKFLGGVDMADGAKIFQHLLGADSAASIQNAAKASGTSVKEVENVLAMVSPLLMSVLGQQKKKHGNAAGGLMGALLSGAVSNALGGGLFGGAPQKPAAKKGNGIDAGDVINILGKLMK